MAHLNQTTIRSPSRRSEGHYLSQTDIVVTVNAKLSIASASKTRVIINENLHQINLNDMTKAYWSNPLQRQRKHCNSDRKVIANIPQLSTQQLESYEPKRQLIQFLVIKHGHCSLQSHTCHSAINGQRNGCFRHTPSMLHAQTRNVYHETHPTL